MVRFMGRENLDDYQASFPVLLETWGRLIYTIGYQRLAVEQLDAVLDELQADLIDVRSVPYSRRPEFRKAALQARYGSRYISAGHWLVGQPRGRTEHQTKPEGIAWLKQYARERSVVLMCMEHARGDCHRHHTICGPAQ
jgi:uncharacterized protein (DUF488 family)